MSEMEVRIVRLDPMRVASTYGFGQGPEGIAWEKMDAYVRSHGLEQDGLNHRYFGFNNPSPSAGSPNYGYEQWITVGPESMEEDGVKIKDFSGGLYAVTRTNLAHITESWHKLAAWREKSPYRFGKHQWLEEVLNHKLDEPFDENAVILDLYLPIVE